MKQLFNLLKERSEILHPVFLAIRYHKDIIFIHPFIDGNGRVARLTMNTVLLQNQYLPIDIPPNNRMNYHLSIKETYSNPVAFYEFMLS
jgi:Fic family protein